ncbi:MAG: IMP cyclohydrolase [Clostridia bacterium]|nr:IMP cyclohydrolase [Clostridia bacterium]
MDIYKINNIAKLIEGNSYVGRGIVIGKTEDGTKALTAYFIMGRSNNSRNRIFVENGDEVIIHPYDASKVEDPSLIIYSPIRKFEQNLIVTNGDQTDTVYDGLKEGKSFSEALESREFEPDAPNFTPRISGMMTFADNDFTYQMSILKSADAEGTACNRFTYSYPALKGLGHFIHTYVCDGAPIPTFQGEPERVAIGNDIDAFTNELWNALDEDNKISLYVRTIDLKTGEIENRMINKFEKV